MPPTATAGTTSRPSSSARRQAGRAEAEPRLRPAADHGARSQPMTGSDANAPLIPDGVRDASRDPSPSQLRRRAPALLSEPPRGCFGGSPDNPPVALLVNS